MEQEEMDNFNKLTPEETELLAILAEECGEVIQAVGKILRHGYDSNWEDGPTNRDQLADEIGDVYLVVGMLVNSKAIKFSNICKRIETKPEKLNKFMHHNHLVGVE